MKVGLVHFMAFPNTAKGEGPILETVRSVLLDDFFDAIEITSIKDAAVRKQVARMIETSKVTIAFGAQPCLLTQGLNLNDLDESGRRKAVDTVKAAIDESYEIGAVGCAFLSGKYEESRKEEAFKLLVDSTNELCEYAKSQGDLQIILETFDWDVDKKSLIGPSAIAKRYAEEISRNHDNFGLLVDLSHTPLIHETPEQHITPIRDYLVHAHIGNCVLADSSYPAYGDNHPRFGFPNGENDVPQVVDFLRVLFQVGFLNAENPPIVSFEIKPFEDEDPHLVIANARRTLDRAWSILEWEGF